MDLSIQSSCYWAPWYIASVGVSAVLTILFLLIMIPRAVSALVKGHVAQSFSFWARFYGLTKAYGLFWFVWAGISILIEPTYGLKIYSQGSPICLFGLILNGLLTILSSLCLKQSGIR